MDHEPGRPAYLALMSSETSLLVRATDDAAVAQKLLSLRSSGLLASGSFSTTTAAICWLTDPVPADVVSSAEESGVLGLSTGVVDGGWLAVVSGGSSSCFNVASSGVGGAVKLLKESVSPVCAVGRFNFASDAYKWLAGSSANDLLQLLGDTIGAVTVASVPYRSSSPRQAVLRTQRMRAHSDDVWSAATVRSAGGVGAVAAAMPSPPASAADPPLCAQPRTRAHVPELSPPSEPVVQSAGSRGLGPAASCPVGPPSRKRRAADVALPWPDPSGALVAVGGRGAPSSRGRLPDQRPAAKKSAPSPRLCTCVAAARVTGEGWSAPGSNSSGLGCRLSTRVPTNRCTCGAAGSKSRLSMDGGVGAARNPAGGPTDDSRSVFSRANISRMVAEGALAWQQYDSDAAMAASLQRAEEQRCSSASPLTATVSSSARACTSWAGSAATSGGVDVCVPVGGGSLVGADPLALERAEVRAPALEKPGVAALSPLSETPLSTGAGAGGRTTVDLPSSPVAVEGLLGSLAAAGRWQDVIERLAGGRQGLFVTGGPGVGKSTFLRGLHKALCARWPLPGQVVIVAPTGSAAKTANGQTYHSFFGFPRDYRMQQKDPVEEASRFIKEERFRPMARRLAQVRAVLLDEVSMVAADKFDVMVELLRQSRPVNSPACMVFCFGDFLQLGPVGGAAMAFTSRSWGRLYGKSMLELSRVHRQSDAAFVRAIGDARFGRCTTAVSTLMRERSVTDEEYKTLRSSVLHLMPRHEDVERHNAECLAELCGASRPKEFVAVDTVEQDKDRDVSLPPLDLSRVTEHSRNAALLDCVAPSVVLHCRGARVMLTSNHYLMLGLYHGSIGCIASYLVDGTPVVRFDHHTLPSGIGRGVHGVHDAADDWLEVECPPVPFEARILSCSGAVAVRRQVPFVLGWGITVHRSQSLSLSEAVLDIAQAFGAGMVNAAISRVIDKERMYVKSFSGSRLLADALAVKYYKEGTRL